MNAVGWIDTTRFDGSNKPVAGDTQEAIVRLYAKADSLLQEFLPKGPALIKNQLPDM